MFPKIKKCIKIRDKAYVNDRKKNYVDLKTR